jgi:hypothetical protein
MTCATINPCTRRLTTGRAACNITAIVLRNLGMSSEQYLNWIATNIQEDYHTQNPKSVHYIVSQNGASYNVVSPQDTAWGMDQFNGPQYPLWASDCGNSQFIYVGLENAATLSNAQYGTLVNLLCCVALEHNIAVDALHIITEQDLSSELTGITILPSLLLADVLVCRNNGGVPPLPNIGDLEDRIEELEECCELVKDAVVLIQTSIDGLPQRVTDLESRVNELEALEGDSQNRIGALEGIVNGFTSQIQALMNIIQQHQICIDRVCPPLNNCLPITYTLEPRQQMLLTPNVPVWINFPNKVEDTVTDSVLTGPLWTANLTCECNYAITVTIGLEPSEWCDGKRVWLDVVACGNTYRVQEIVPGEGNQTVMLTGTIPLSVPPVCNDVHVMVGTNDITTPFKTIRYGNINIACV